MTKKVTRRIAVGVVAFESYGIERGDRAIIAMTGDVRVGELGYFETGSYWGGDGCPRVLRSHSWFAFLCNQDKRCWPHYENGNGICLRSRLDRCEGQHGAEPYEERPIEPPYPGDVLVATYGRVVAVERDGEAVGTSLSFRCLDERERATTTIAPSVASDPRPRPRMRLSPPSLPPIEKRNAPMTSEQHEEIARLIKSSMDSTAQNPKPELTYQGRIVVRREVTTLARIANARRLKGHATTFRRALAKFEQGLGDGSLSITEQRAGRLAIEHLWRWLRGYITPEQTEEQRQAQADLWAENERAREAAKRKEIQDELRGMILDFGSVMLYPCPKDFPGEGLREGVMVKVRKGKPIDDGALGVVGFGELIRMDYVHQVDPQRTRLGDDEEILMNIQLDFIGPVIIPDNVIQFEDEWPAIIGDTDPTPTKILRFDREKGNDTD